MGKLEFVQLALTLPIWSTLSQTLDYTLLLQPLAEPFQVSSLFLLFKIDKLSFIIPAYFGIKWAVAPTACTKDGGPIG